MPTTHVVAQGESIPTIARLYGFGDWMAIFNHPSNAALRARRPSPHVLRQGDEVVIPDPAVKRAACATELRHRFRVDLGCDRLKLTLRDPERTPLSGEAFTVRAGDWVVRGKTTGDGHIDVALPRRVHAIVLTLDDKPWLTWRLRVGHLDPTHEPDDGESIVSGIQARLNNLGHGCGPIDGKLGPSTVLAIQRFQEDVLGRAEATGEIDDETRDALVREHGV